MNVAGPKPKYSKTCSAINVRIKTANVDQDMLNKNSISGKKAITLNGPSLASLAVSLQLALTSTKTILIRNLFILTTFHP